MRPNALVFNNHTTRTVYIRAIVDRNDQALIIEARFDRFAHARPIAVGESLNFSLENFATILKDDRIPCRVKRREPRWNADFPLVIGPLSDPAKANPQFTIVSALGASV